MNLARVNDSVLISRLKKLETQNRIWKISGLVAVLAFGLSLAAGVRAQQTQRIPAPAPAQTPPTQDFVLRNASGEMIGEWTVNNGVVESVGPQSFPPGRVVPIPQLPRGSFVPLQVVPNGPAPRTQTDAQFEAQLLLRDPAGKQLGDWIVKTGAVLESYNAAGKLIWSIPMKVVEPNAR